MAGLERRHRHALAEGRVEADHRVTERDDARRESGPVRRSGATCWSGTCGTPTSPSGCPLPVALAEVLRQHLVGERRTSRRTSAAARPFHVRRSSAPSCRPRSNSMPSPTGCVVRRARDDHLFGDQAVRDVHLWRGVVDADVDGVLAWTSYPHCSNHTGSRVPRPAASTTRSARPPRRLRSGTPVTRWPVESAARRRPAPDGHVVDAEDPAADLPLQVRPAWHVSGEFVPQSSPVPRRGPRRRNGCSRAGFPAWAHPRPPCRRAVRETALRTPGAASHQKVHMAALWDRGAVRRCVGDSSRS